MIKILGLLTLSMLFLSGCLLQPFRKLQRLVRSNSTKAQFYAWSKAMDYTNDELDFHKRMNSWRMNEGVYKADGILDYPRDHLITHAWRSGDCDDWSSMFMEASFQAGYTSFLMTVDTFHTVCVFGSHGKYYHNSNYAGVRGSYETLNELAQSIKLDYSKYTIRNRQIQVIK